MCLLWPTLHEWRANASSPPTGCRTIKSSDRTQEGDSYECVLCDAIEPALREGVTYLVNGDCTFNPLQGRITLPSPVILTEGVTVRPLDIQQSTEIVGQLLVRGSQVTVQDLFISHPLHVAGEVVAELVVHNVTVTNSHSVLTVEPSDIHHDINITGLEVSDVRSIHTDDEPQNPSALQPIATFFHSYGNTNFFCGDDQLVIVQPMIPSGNAAFLKCDIINFTAILDAYGNAFTYDMYGTPVPEWVQTMRSWAITLTAASAGLLLLSRKPASTPPNPEQNTTPKPSAWI